METESDKPTLVFHLNIAANAVYLAAQNLSVTDGRYAALLQIHQRIIAMMREEAGMDKPEAPK